MTQFVVSFSSKTYFLFKKKKRRPCNKEQWLASNMLRHRIQNGRYYGNYVQLNFQELGFKNCFQSFKFVLQVFIFLMVLFFQNIETKDIRFTPFFSKLKCSYKFHSPRWDIGWNGESRQKTCLPKRQNGLSKCFWYLSTIQPRCLISTKEEWKTKQKRKPL